MGARAKLHARPFYVQLIRIYKPFNAFFYIANIAVY